MKTSSVVSALLLAGGSVAQTPAGFTPNVKAHLDVIFGTKAVNPPGMALAKTG
jgi:phosphatidylethanolamine-binding protein